MMSRAGIFGFFFRFSFKSTSHIFLWEIAFVLYHIQKFSKINTLFFSDRMSLRKLAELYKNPRARLNLSVSSV